MVEVIDAATFAGFPDLAATWDTLVDLSEQSRKDLIEHLDRVQRPQFDLLNTQLDVVTNKRNIVWGTLAGLMLFAVSALILLRLEILSSKARQRAQVRIRHLAYNDSLTGLNNRPSFQERLAVLIDQGLAFTLIMLDVDEFKKINDTYGHAAGDR